MADKAQIEEVLGNVLNQVCTDQVFAQPSVPLQRPVQFHRSKKAASAARKVSGRLKGGVVELKINTRSLKMIPVKRSKAHPKFPEGELDHHPETVEIESVLFETARASLADDNYTGPPPNFFGDMDVTDYATKQGLHFKVVGHESQALSAIEESEKDVFKELDSKGKLDLLRAAIKFYENKLNSGTQTIYPPGTKVACADWGKLWFGSVIASFIDGSSNIYYRIKFEKTEDQAYHIAHHVEIRKKGCALIPAAVAQNTQKMKMVAKLEQITNEKKNTMAGRIVEVEILKGPYSGQVRKFLVEMVDVYQHKIVLYDFLTKAMLQMPVWRVYKFGDLVNRKLPPTPTAFTETGTAPFEGHTSNLVAPQINEGEVEAEVLANSKNFDKFKKGNKQQKKKAAEGQPLVPMSKEEAQEWMSFTIMKSIDAILGQLVAHYDGRSGNILTEVQNVKDELDSLKKEVGQLKGNSEGQTASLMDTLKGCSMSAMEMTAVSKKCLGAVGEDPTSPSFGDRLRVLEEKVAGIDKVKEQNTSILEILAEVKQVLTTTPLPSQSIQQVPQPMYTSYPPQQFHQQCQQLPSYQPPHQYQQMAPQQYGPLPQQNPQPSLQSTADLLISTGNDPGFLAFSSPAKSPNRSVGQIMANLKSFERKEKEKRKATEKVIRIGDEEVKWWAVLEDTRHSIVSNSDIALETATRVLQKSGSQRNVGGMTFRRFVSFDETNDRSLEITTIEDTHFKVKAGRCQQIETGIVTDYGVMHPMEDGRGTQLVGVILESVPAVLNGKISKLLKQIGIRQCRDGDLIGNTISSCLRIFFNEMKCLASSLPLHFMGKPVYNYDTAATEGALNNLIHNNVEPLKSFLKHLRQRLIVVDEVLLTRCMRVGLKDFQKAYRAHKSCKHRQSGQTQPMSLSSCTSASEADSAPSPKKGRIETPSTGRRHTKTPVLPAAKKKVEQGQAVGCGKMEKKKGQNREGGLKRKKEARPSNSTNENPTEDDSMEADLEAAMANMSDAEKKAFMMSLMEDEDENDN